ncbi:MAG: exo-beta-N-acetylmuramidase NamZ domain-containing protein, partial [Fidelibacterota bacterium]
PFSRVNRAIRHLLVPMMAVTCMVARGQERDFQFSQVMQFPEMDFYPHVMTGLDVLEEIQLAPLRGRTLAILTNQTAVDRKGIHLLDVLADFGEDFRVKIILSPQFGFLAHGTESVTVMRGGRDPRFDAEVKILWGRKSRPDKDDLRGVDLILVDLQDPGIRFFTFMTTITKVMEAAALDDIPVMVLDRPNPLNGLNIDGPNVRPPYQSVVGYHLVPIRHGLTVGEYALMVNETGWIRGAERVRLTVVPMENWEREMWMEDTDLPWIPPAPHTDDAHALLAAVGMGLLEGTNISAGLGTDLPYLQFGAPWMSSELVSRDLERKRLPGVEFHPVTFIPDSLSRLIPHPLYRGEMCSGVGMTITDKKSFSPLLTAATVLSVVSRHHPGKFRWVANNYIDKLYGHDYLRIFLAQERNPAKLPATWSLDVIQFSEFRKPYLLY